MYLALHVIPNASKNQVMGWVEDGKGGRALKIKIRATPVDGAANKALIAYISEILGLAKSDIQLAAGEHSRHKRVQIAGDELEINKIINMLINA